MTALLIIVCALIAGFGATKIIQYAESKQVTTYAWFYTVAVLYVIGCCAAFFFIAQATGGQP